MLLSGFPPQQATEKESKAVAETQHAKVKYHRGSIGAHLKAHPKATVWMNSEIG